MRVCVLAYVRANLMLYQHWDGQLDRAVGLVAPGFTDRKLLCRRRLPRYLLLEGRDFPVDAGRREKTKVEGDVVETAALPDLSTMSAQQGRKEGIFQYKSHTCTPTSTQSY